MTLLEGRQPQIGPVEAEPGPDIRSELGELALSLSENFGRPSSSGTISTLKTAINGSNGYSFNSYNLRYRQGCGWKFSIALVPDRAQGTYHVYDGTPGHSRLEDTDSPWMADEAISSLKADRAARLFWGLQMMQQDLIADNIV